MPKDCDSKDENTSMWHGILEKMGQPWKKGQIFDVVECSPGSYPWSSKTTCLKKICRDSNGNKIGEEDVCLRRKLYDPVVSTHVILLITCLIMIYKKHYLQALLIGLGTMVSTTYHLSVETCFEDMDMMLCIFIAIVMGATCLTFGIDKWEVLIVLLISSLVVWWIAGDWFISKDNTEARDKWPGNHPFYDCLHSTFHLMAFTCAAGLALMVRENDCPS